MQKSLNENASEQKERYDEAKAEEDERRRMYASGKELFCSWRVIVLSLYILNTKKCTIMLQRVERAAAE